MIVISVSHINNHFAIIQDSYHTFARALTYRHTNTYREVKLVKAFHYHYMPIWLI